MKSSQSPQRYDRNQTYRWNYDHAPESTPHEDVPRVAGEWTFCGLPVDSPLGIPAGPLLNGRWVLYYAALGFDVLTYKTVRSSARRCYRCQISCRWGSTRFTTASDRSPYPDEMKEVRPSPFGMPSDSPDVWRRDIEWT
ncbi:MAG: hypothetical protein R3B91_04320 [Planctomycetaceae bacterium]